MKARLRALERQFVEQRFEILMKEAADEYVVACYAADSRGRRWPLPRAFVLSVFGKGFNPKGLVPAMNYLEECVRFRTFPDDATLYQTLVGWRDEFGYPVRW
jgi:hypothetical protein